MNLADIDGYLAAGAARLRELDLLIEAETEPPPRAIGGPKKLRPCPCGCGQRLGTRERQQHVAGRVRGHFDMSAWKERHRTYVLESSNFCPASFGCAICAEIQGAAAA